MKGLVVISLPGSHDQERRLRVLAEWMGIATRAVTLGGRPQADELDRDLRDGWCAALSVETLAALRELLPSDVLGDFKLLVFSAGGSQRHRELLSWLTEGAVTELAAPAEAHVFHFPEGSRPYSRAFAGQSFELKRAGAVSSFVIAGGGRSDAQEVLLAGDRPVFVRVGCGTRELFLLAVAEVPDIGTQLSVGSGVEEHYDRLVPLLILLRHWFGDACWHGVKATAQLIIDDPLLDQNYGFLSFGALRGSMRAMSYATSIAFIPWNHWRTSPRKARRLFERDPNLTVCVHGCDHTNKEFDEVDLNILQAKADTALCRMERQRARTGVAFDPVMVFPQGRFSSAALAALRASGFLAAVNSTCFPTDAGAAPLTIADFLRPAITKFYGFPLFQRRYPRRLVDFAFDLFIGRPVLIVQHHEDFREGCGRLESFVAGLRKLEPRLTWGALSRQLSQCCMVRTPAERSMEVRFFTNQFRFGGAQESLRRLLFSKEEPDPSAITSVLVDGGSVPFSHDNGLLTFSYEVDAGQGVDVRVVDRARRSTPALSRSTLQHTVGVAARRALSEIRDNILAKHSRLLAAATGLATRMKATGKDEREE
jgi:hypothetical protein